jgi:hypothetical protein
MTDSDETAAELSAGQVDDLFEEPVPDEDGAPAFRPDTLRVWRRGQTIHRFHVVVPIWLALFAGSILVASAMSDEPTGEVAWWMVMFASPVFGGALAIYAYQYYEGWFVIDRIRGEIRVGRHEVIPFRDVRDPGVAAIDYTVLLPESASADVHSSPVLEVAPGRCYLRRAGLGYQELRWLARMLAAMVESYEAWIASEEYAQWVQTNVDAAQALRIPLDARARRLARTMVPLALTIYVVALWLGHAAWIAHLVGGIVLGWPLAMALRAWRAGTFVVDPQRREVRIGRDQPLTFSTLVDPKLTLTLLDAGTRRERTAAALEIQPGHTVLARADLGRPELDVLVATLAAHAAPVRDGVDVRGDARADPP